MNKQKAERRIQRRITKLKTCPFCGAIPKIEARCDEKHSTHGSFGHYATRKPCCPATSSGQTEVFFCNNWEEPNYYLWWRMTSRLVNDWNRRQSSEATK